MSPALFICLCLPLHLAIRAVFANSRIKEGNTKRRNEQCLMPACATSPPDYVFWEFFAHGFSTQSQHGAILKLKDISMLGMMEQLHVLLVSVMLRFTILYDHVLC